MISKTKLKESHSQLISKTVRDRNCPSERTIFLSIGLILETTFVCLNVIGLSVRTRDLWTSITCLTGTDDSRSQQFREKKKKKNDINFGV